MSEEKRFLIVGAGLAGLALAEALLDQGVPGEAIGVLDAAEGPGAGSSGGPGFLLNPLPGRSLAPKPGYLDAFAHALPWLAKLQARTPEPCLKELPLLRPLLVDHKGSQRLKRSYPSAREQVTPLLSLEAKTPTEAMQQCPWLANIEGAIEVSPACALWSAPALQGQIQWLQAQGVTFGWHQHIIQMARQERQRSLWRLETTQGEPHTGETVIWATGASPAPLVEAWQAPSIERVGGVLLQVLPPAGVALACLLSGAGVHIAPRPDGRWIVGATYERPGTTPLTESESITSLVDKAAAFLPIIRDCEVEKVWRGQRLVCARTKMPLVGPDPQHPNSWHMGAFGAKGLLMIPGHAHALASQCLGQLTTLS